METTRAALPARLTWTGRWRIRFSLAALAFGGSVITLAALVQFAERLPSAVRATHLFASLVRGYTLSKVVLTGYSGPRYLGLLGIGVGIYWLLPSVRWRRIFLLACSALLAVALVQFPVVFLVGIAVAIVVVHLLARAATRWRGVATGGIVGIAVVYLVVLALPMLTDVAALPRAVEQMTIHYLVLQGYFMFLPLKFIHYLWDVSTGRAKVYSLKTLALWVFFFPSFRNAPYERIQSFAAQIKSDNFVLSRVGWGLKRILIGAIKGAVGCLILSTFSPASVWAAPGEASVGQLWLAAYGYSVGLFLEFSGFAEAMIGSSALLGYQLSENFDRPYLQFDVRGFWRTWNVTTSHWLRDYIYIPLGGSRRGNVYLNLAVTMLVAGAWHALSLNFLIWGAWHGLGLVISRYLFERRRRSGRPEPALDTGVLRTKFKWLVGVFITFHFVTVGWVFHHNGYSGVSALDSLRMVARMFGLW
jgi:D-alanyl-lipoteichoic acid acyltransferase DltB (MBOAT superfamily)